MRRGGTTACSPFADEGLAHEWNGGYRGIGLATTVLMVLKGGAAEGADRRVVRDVTWAHTNRVTDVGR